MLAVSLRRLRPDPYYFCRSEGCPVVYFSEHGESSFTEAELREAVYQKHPGDPDVLVCYCFRHKVGSLLHASGDSAAKVIADIRAGIDAGQCACDIRNPQGSCCLGNVTVLAKVGQSKGGVI